MVLRESNTMVGDIGFHEAPGPEHLREISPGAGMDGAWDSFLRFRYANDEVRSGDRTFPRQQFVYVTQAHPPRYSTVHEGLLLLFIVKTFQKQQVRKLFNRVEWIRQTAGMELVPDGVYL
jgi:hypothetical protein